MKEDNRGAVSLTNLATRLLQKMKEDEAARIASLPIGTCPECEGTGELGGQFCGGYWTCEVCGGSGVTTREAEG